MWVQRQNKFVASRHVATEPFDDVAVDVRRVALDSRRQVQNNFALNSRLDNLHYRFADLDRKIRLSQSKTLRRIFITNCGADKFAFKFATNFGRTCRNVDNARLVETENNTTLQRVN